MTPPLCLHCQLPITRKLFPCLAKRNGGRFCSRVCSNHYHRLGRPSANWRGGIKINGGYKLVYAPHDPHANSTGYALVSRIVMAEKLGRPLTHDEIVHHCNGDVTDDRPENLDVMQQSDHIKLHMVGGVLRTVEMA